MDERDEIATLLHSRPNRPLPQADQQRTALLEQMRATPPARRALRWTIRRPRVPAPMLAAGALAATLAVVTAGTVVTGQNVNESVAPGTSVDTPAPASTLTEFLQRVDAAVGRQPETVVGADQFLYLRSRDASNFQPGEPPQIREEWHSADSARFGLLEGDDRSVDVYEGGERPPAGMPALDAAILYTSPSRMSDLENVEPAALLAAINRLSAPGAPPATRAFDRVREMLASGGLAFPRVRALLYHVAALIPGVQYRPDGADVLGRHGAVLTLERERSASEPIIDPTLIMAPDTGALLGYHSGAYLHYATVDKIGDRPDGAPASITEPEKPGDRTFRGLDYANNVFAVPRDEHFGTASHSDATALPTLSFRDGVATRKDATGRTIRYELVPDHRPVGFADLLGRGEGPVLLLSVREVGKPAAQTAHAILFLDGSHADNSGMKLVAWLDPSPASTTAPARAVAVRVSGTTVTVTHTDGRPQEYRWDGDRFALKN